MTKFNALIAMLSIACTVHLTPALAQNSAQTWRCGSAYSDQPCAGGKPVAASDARAESDRRAADAATRRTEQRADALERIRIQRENDAMRQDRQVAAERRRAALAERKMAMAERDQQLRLRNESRAPRKSTKSFKSPAPR